MSLPTIAAIIPVYNRPTVVLDALRSVAAQRLLPSRLIVVDDGSTDHTPQSVETWLATNRLGCTVQVLRQANRGAALARNAGAEAARDCTLLAFLDSDDLWPSDYLERMAAAFAASPAAVAASCARDNLNCRTGQARRIDTRVYAGAATTALFVKGPAGTPNTVFQAQTFRQIGGFPPHHSCEDYHLALRISMLGPWLHVPGEAVVARRLLSVLSGEEPPLSKKYHDRRALAAAVLTQFIEHEEGARVIPSQLWRRRLGVYWLRAGCEHKKYGRLPEAASCFQQSIAYWPWSLRSRWQALCLWLQPKLAA